MKKILLLITICFSLLNAEIKTKDTNDVHQQITILKNKILHLAGEKKIKANYIKLPEQKNKLPRQVFQKTLEVLKKINKYRQNTALGQVNIPAYPSRSITSEDVYFNVKRLNKELDILLQHIQCPHIESLEENTPKFTGKSYDDNYFELWSASLAMDELLGKGFSPTDNYEQSLLIIDVIKFLRNTQNNFEDVQKPLKKERKHPNHVLYATHKLIDKISKVEKKLWMDPVEVPLNPQRIITPTEVYDSMQTVITELKRIRRRLGVERLYEAPVINTIKTPSDVLQNIEYAIELFPEFKLEKAIKQYNVDSLKKSQNEIYALSKFVLDKLNYLKSFKGIMVESKKIPYIYGLNEMHVYQKSIEAMEKINKTRIVNKLYEVAVPESPTKKKDANAVYEILLMIDDEVSIIMEHNGINDIKRWSYVIDKNKYFNKNYADVYNNLWKITSVLDNLRGEQYTPNETYVLAKRIEQRMHNITKYLTHKKHNMYSSRSLNKQPSDVFNLSVKVYDQLTLIIKRANISAADIKIPKVDLITPDTVYNALRMINASLIDINIHFGLDFTVENIVIDSTKTPSDVYDVVLF